MVACQVKSCGNNFEKNRKLNKKLRFFTFPNDRRMDVWKKAAGITEITVKRPRICSIHFEQKYFRTSWIKEKYNLTAKNERGLTSDAVPTLFIYEDTSSNRTREIINKELIESEKEHKDENPELGFAVADQTGNLHDNERVTSASFSENVKRKRVCETSNKENTVKQLKLEYEAKLAYLQGSLKNEHLEKLQLLQLLKETITVLVFERLRNRTLNISRNNKNVPEEVVHCLSRCMTWFRLRKLNKEYKQQTNKRKHFKKLAKLSEIHGN